MHGFHALRGLHGHRGDGRDAVAIMRRDGLEVCRNARAGGRIEPRDRQHDRGSRIYVIGQFFESLREKNCPQKSGPAAQERRASRQVEMYACVRSRATSFLMRPTHLRNPRRLSKPNGVQI
jgi:hypothetical protein